jgi:hypothetical protein
LRCKKHHTRSSFVYTPIFAIKKATGALRFFLFRYGQNYNAHFWDKKTTRALGYFLFKEDQKNNAIFCDKKGTCVRQLVLRGLRFFLIEIWTKIECQFFKSPMATKSLSTTAEVS